MKFLISILTTLLIFSISAEELKQIVLTKKNTVIMRERFSGSSVAKIQDQLLTLSGNLDTDDEIYLVLDTPGGSVIAGMSLIDTVKAIPQKVNTITLFAASMGYQTVQNLGTRYIVPSGILMSHRASLGGLSGQLDGEIESRLNFYKDITGALDAIAAKRVGISLEDYKKLILNEYWAGAFKSVKENHADEIITAKCSKSLMGTYEEHINTFFGSFKVRFSNCPLIRSPLGFSRGNYQAYEKFTLEYASDRNLKLSDFNM